MRYKLIDVGRGKFNGFVESCSGVPEHVESVVLREARKHLMSRDIELCYELDERGHVADGEIIVGGVRVVGKFEREDVR